MQLAGAQLEIRSSLLFDHFISTMEALFLFHFCNFTSVMSHIKTGVSCFFY